MAWAGRAAGARPGERRPCGGVGAACDDCMLLLLAMAAGSGAARADSAASSPNSASLPSCCRTSRRRRPVHPKGALRPFPAAAPTASPSRAPSHLHQQLQVHIVALGRRAVLLAVAAARLKVDALQGAASRGSRAERSRGVGGRAAAAAWLCHGPAAALLQRACTENFPGAACRLLLRLGPRGATPLQSCRRRPGLAACPLHRFEAASCCNGIRRHRCRLWGTPVIRWAPCVKAFVQTAHHGCSCSTRSPGGLTSCQERGRCHAALRAWLPGTRAPGGSQPADQAPPGVARCHRGPQQTAKHDASAGDAAGAWLPGQRTRPWLHLAPPIPFMPS
jgi:hypothetical protein